MTTAGPSHELSWFGDRCIRVEFASDSSDLALRTVHAAFRTLRDAGIPALLDITLAYRTLLLTFDALRLDPVRAEREVALALESVSLAERTETTRTVEVPACYDPGIAPDITSLARDRHLTIEQIADLHSNASYTVAFIGFSPGFPYLTGLPKELHTPRHPQPRTRVAPGSIGIAGDQAGIYPLASPGGWQLIGRTPLTIFDASRDPAALLAPGDRVQFTPITLKRFRELAPGGA